MSNLQDLLDLLDGYNAECHLPQQHVLDNTNFAAHLLGYKQWSEEKQETKEPMPDGVCSKLRAYISTGDADHLQGTTFRYIHMYMNKRKEVGRLEVACADFGYTMAELNDMVSNCKTAVDVAREIISRV